MLQKLQFVELAILTWILLNSKYEFMLPHHRSNWAASRLPSVFRHPEIFSYFKFPKIYENQEICFPYSFGKYKVSFRIQVFIF